jgi:hypothetical protein
MELQFHFVGFGVFASYEPFIAPDFDLFLRSTTRLAFFISTAAAAQLRCCLQCDLIMFFN